MRSDAGDHVQLVVSGGSYRNWYEVDIDSDIFNPADSFMVKALVPSTPFVGAFREGQKCDVYVGDDRQMAGTIDDVEFTGDYEQERMTLTGRDLGAFLVDCESASFKAANYTLQTLAQKLLKSSWGIKNVLISNEDNRKLLLGKNDRKSSAGVTRPGTQSPFVATIPRAKTKVDPGKKVAQILDEHTRRLGVTWWLTAQGDLFLGKPNYNQGPSYDFVIYKARTPNAERSNNVLEYSVRYSMGERYSEVSVVGVGVSSKVGMFTGSKNPAGSKFKATVTDPDLVNRGIERKLIVSDTDCPTAAMAQRRAEFEMQVRQLRGLTIELTVPGFRQGDRLFAIDTLAHLKIESLNIDDVFYVVQRRFLDAPEKRRTKLTLHKAGVWLP